MKNLRKVLALVLVVAMMASLVISASALSAKDYTDYSEVVNKDAVAMLTELGIINGYPTGDFQPAGVVTRAEMAKMIYVVLNSGNDQAPTPDAQRYSDVYKGHWAEGYVAFCDDLGIIDGMGDGTFAPSAPVTGVQAAKMLLVAMGYDSAVEGFTGSNWDYGVLKAASAAGLFEGFTASVNEGCTRDNAALLVYNALIGDCVSYVGNTAVATGDTLIGTCYGLVAVTGVVVANEYANLFGMDPLMAGKTEIAFIGDQYSDLFHAIDPLVLNAGKLSPATDAFVNEIKASMKDEAFVDFEDWMEVKGEVNDSDEYASFVFSVGTDLAQIGTTVTVYAKLKGNYEQFTNLVEYAKYDMFSGKVVGNVVADDDCVVFYNEGAAGDFAAEINADYTTRYFENYKALWLEVDGSRVHPSYDEDNTANYWEDMTSAVRGEYLWAIDVDGDGVAEIVLKYRETFAVAQYDKYYETWSFDVNAPMNGDDVVWTDIAEEDIIFEGEELKAGMKVLVVEVDGTYYVHEAATVKGIPEEINYNTDKEYYAAFDGAKYYESGLYWADDIKLGELRPDETGWAGGFYAHIVGNGTPDNPGLDVDAANEYTLYLDDFGNIVAWEQAKSMPTDAYLLVTGAANYLPSINVSESIIIGAKAANEMTIGVEPYFAARSGRADAISATLNTLYTLKSTDKIGERVFFGATLYNYVSYDSVFNIVNDYNRVLDGTTTKCNDVNYENESVYRYGWLTTLVKADFVEGEEETLVSSVSALNGLKDGEYDGNEKKLSFINLDGINTDKIESKDIGLAFKDQGVYIGSNTLIYIYIYDEATQLGNVITLRGTKDMPNLVLNVEGKYGLYNAYAVPGNPMMTGSYDAEVVVFEIWANGQKGLPEKGINSWIYVYDVENNTRNCQTVKAINGDGELIVLQHDYEIASEKLPVDYRGWATYIPATGATCDKHDEHVIVVDKADINKYPQFDCFAYTDDMLSFQQITAIDATTYDLTNYVTFVDNDTSDADGNALNNYYDLAGIPVLVAYGNVDGYYDQNLVFASNWDKISTSKDIPAYAANYYYNNNGIIGAWVTTWYADNGAGLAETTYNADWFALTAKKEGKDVIVGIVIEVDETSVVDMKTGYAIGSDVFWNADGGSYVTDPEVYNYLAYWYGVDASDMIAGEGMEAPPAGDPMAPPAQ